MCGTVPSLISQLSLTTLLLLHLCIVTYINFTIIICTQVLNAVSGTFQGANITLLEAELNDAVLGDAHLNIVSKLLASCMVEQRTIYSIIGWHLWSMEQLCSAGVVYRVHTISM